jgi:hypothetical protein
MTARNETAHTLPVPISPAKGGPSERPSYADARIAAQLLGRDGERRGLRGGAPVLEAARAAYLRAQWSGGADRRLPAGCSGSADL